jgi:hypothetical protein
MSTSTGSFRYNLRSSTVTPSKGDLQAAHTLMSLRSWKPAAQQLEWFNYDEKKAQWQPAVAERRVQPDRAARHATKAHGQFWPTTTVADRVKARHAGFTEVSQY